jgi:hypothetical protein
MIIVAVTSMVAGAIPPHPGQMVRGRLAAGSSAAVEVIDVLQ